MRSHFVQNIELLLFGAFQLSEEDVLRTLSLGNLKERDKDDFCFKMGLKERWQTPVPRYVELMYVMPLLSYNFVLCSFH